MPAAPKTPIVCYVTDRKSLDDSGAVRNLLVTIRAAIAAGVDWVQIREKDLPARELLDLARSAVNISAKASSTKAVPHDESLIPPRSVRIFVNDRLDVALAAGAAGVHLGGGFAPVERDVVRWLRDGNAPADFVVGVSCHSLEEVCAAENSGANYAFFGPVFDSPAKRSFGSPQGVARLEEVCRSVKMPVLAIGGVNPENARECSRAGASGVAAIRLIQRPEGTEDNLKMKLTLLHEGK